MTDSDQIEGVAGKFESSAQQRDDPDHVRRGGKRLHSGWAHLAASGTDQERIVTRRVPSRHLVEEARADFMAAAHAYVSAAREQQRGAAAQATVGTAHPDIDVAIAELGGRLGVEAETALENARRAGGSDVTVAQRFAEDLRTRLAYAAPELFDPSVGQAPTQNHDTPSRSR